MDMIPITFLTGFYVTQVVGRYWDQFMSLPWPDKIALKIVSFIKGKVNHKWVTVVVIEFKYDENTREILCFLHINYGMRNL